MAKTQAGKTYAVIQNNRCHWIFTQTDLAEYNENQIQVVDVTGNVPNVGDDWNGSAFSPHTPTADEVAATGVATKISAIRADLAAQLADAGVQAWLAETPISIDSRVAAMITVAQLRDEVKRLSKVLQILIRERGV